jgi:hypothetical protein
MGRALKMNAFDSIWKAIISCRTDEEPLSESQGVLQRLFRSQQPLFPLPLLLPLLLLSFQLLMLLFPLYYVCFFANSTFRIKCL